MEYPELEGTPRYHRVHSGIHAITGTRLALPSSWEFAAGTKRAQEWELKWGKGKNHAAPFLKFKIFLEIMENIGH